MPDTDNKRKVEIKFNGAHTEIFVEGKPLTNVSYFCIEQRAGDIPRLTVEFPTTKGEVTLESIYREVYHD